MLKTVEADIRNAAGAVILRAGAVVPQSVYDAATGAAASGAAVAAPGVERMPFVPGVWEGRPPHEVEWQKARGLAHDEYEKQLGAETAAAVPEAPTAPKAPRWPAVVTPDAPKDGGE